MGGGVGAARGASRFMPSTARPRDQGSPMPPMSGLRQYSAAGRLRPSPAGPSPGRWPSPTGRGDAWIERDDLLVGQRQPQPTRFELDARQPRDAQYVNDRLTLPVLAQGRQVMAGDGRRRHGAVQQCDRALSPGSLSGLGIVGCETASAVHFLPAFCPIAGLWACKSGKTVLAGAASRYRRPKPDRLLGGGIHPPRPPARATRRPTTVERR